MFQDSEEQFNFWPSSVSNTSTRKNAVNNPEGVDGSNKKKPSKRSSEDIIYSFIKKPAKGLKVVKIEIYNSDKLKSDEGIHGVCKCTADICVQHVVQNSYMDEIYLNVRDIVAKLEGSILKL